MFGLKNIFLIFIKFIIVFSIIVGYTACSKSKTNTVLESEKVDSIENVNNTCDSLQEILNNEEIVYQREFIDFDKYIKNLDLH